MMSKRLNGIRQIDLRACLARTGCTSMVFHQCQDGSEHVFTPNGGNCPYCHSKLKGMQYYMRHYIREWKHAMGHDNVMMAVAGLACYAWFVVNSVVVLARVL